MLEAYRPKLVRALNSLLAADVAIYPVDASELKPDPAFDVANEDIGIHPLMPGEAPHLPMFSDAALSAIELANRSGGEAYFHTNDLADALRKVILAEQSSYTLGFYASGEPDNRYHPIHVLVKQDGIRLRYRPGYWDVTKPPAGLHPSDLRVALESPFTLSKIQIEARVISHSRNSQELGLIVFIASDDLTVERQKGAGTAMLDILFGQKDAKGRGFVIPPYRIPVSMTEAGWASHDWFSTKVKLALLKKTTTVRIIVRDEGSGHLGSVDIPLNSF